MRFRLVLASTIAAHASAPAIGSSAEVQLVGSHGLVAVLDGSQARIFLTDGRFLMRLPPPRDLTQPSPAGSPEQEQERREQIFELFDVPTELRDTQEAEDLVEDELTLAERSAGARDRVPPSLERTALLAAASSAGLWVGVAGNLHRVGPAVETARAGPLPRSARALAAADNGALVVATATELLASPDAGKSFRSLMRVGRPPTHLVIDPAMAWMAWADASGVYAIRGQPRPSLLLAHPIRDLQVCGGQLVALAEDGVYLSSSEGDLQRVSGPVPGRTIPACGRAGAGPWLVVGEGLLMSVDQGRTFRPRADAPAGIILSAAFTGDRIWLFSAAAGLTSIAFEEQPVPSVRPAVTSVDALPEAGGARWASFLLPRLTVAASYATTAHRRDLRALAVAELPLGGPDPRLRYPRPVAAHAFAQVEPGAPPPQVAQPPVPAYPAPYVSPYPPRDPDALCLVATRVRAVARAQAEPERARSLVARAGRAAWLPELRLRGEKRLGRSESLDLRAGGTTAASRDALGLDASDDVRYEVRATWDLPRLVFSPEEVAAVQQALRMADMRREIEAQVNRIYFERRRLLVNPAGAPPAEATGALLRVEELEAELDALSAGEFSRCRGAGPALSGP